MTGTDTQLRVMVKAGEQTELVNLARRCNGTAKMLGQLAVRQMLVASRGGSIPAVPPPEPAERYDSITLWLQPDDRAALDALAKHQKTTPEALASLAVRQLLAQAWAGTLPMLAPTKPELEPPDPFAGSEDRRASCNFEKAKLTLDKLTVLADLGLDPAVPQAHIAFMKILDQMEDFKPG